MKVAGCEEDAIEVKALTNPLINQMSSLKNQMSSLSDLIDTFKVECTKAYHNGVDFVISSLKT